MFLSHKQQRTTSIEDEHEDEDVKKRRCDHMKKQIR